MLTDFDLEDELEIVLRDITKGRATSLLHKGIVVGTFQGTSDTWLLSNVNIPGSLNVKREIRFHYKRLPWGNEPVEYSYAWFTLKGKDRHRSRPLTESEMKIALSGYREIKEEGQK